MGGQLQKLVHLNSAPAIGSAQPHRRAGEAVTPAVHKMVLPRNVFVGQHYLPVQNILHLGVPSRTFHTQAFEIALIALQIFRKGGE